MYNKWLALFLMIPVSFFFHFYEYNERNGLGGEAHLLLPGTLITIFVVAILTHRLKTATFVIGLVVSLGLSLLLATFFIPDDSSWFKPFGLYFAVFFIHIVYVLAVLLIRMIFLTLVKLFKRH